MSNIVNWLKITFPANRIAVIGTFLTALAAQVTTLAGAWPDTSATAKGLVAGAAFLAQAAVIVKYLTGWQAWEARVHDAAIQIGVDHAVGYDDLPTVVDAPTDAPADVDPEQYPLPKGV